MQATIENDDLAASLRAIASPRRRQVLAWLKDPRAHFPPQVDGDLVKDGVCGNFVAEKLGVSAPTASEHLRILAAAGLVVPTRIKQWTFWRRDEAAVRRLKKTLAAVL